MNGEPLYILHANIRRYEGILADLKTPQATRQVVVRLLEEMREQYEAQMGDMRHKAVQARH